MKKTLLLFIALFGFMAASAQPWASVGIIGDATPTGWDSDTDMITTDNITYTITMTFTAGSVKFRAEDAWTNNWGGGPFPSGTAVFNSGGNIGPVPAGTYTVTFNVNTLEYSFVGSTSFPSIGIWGPAVDPVNGFLGDDIEMTTTDGEQYILSGFEFTSGSARFRQDDDNLQVWSNVDFPEGVAIADGPPILVEGGTYSVYFNRLTLEYNFAYPSVGIIGDAVNGWDPNPDTDLQTTDGEVYSLMGITLLTGELKFRQDDSWDVNWGTGGINPDVLIPGGNNIQVTAGTYDILFNRLSLEYSITPTILGVGNNSVKPFSVYPNPAKSEWNFSSDNYIIESIEIFDIMGKKVYSATPSSNNANVNASILAGGTYYAKVSSSNAVQTIKLVKE